MIELDSKRLPLYLLAIFGLPLSTARADNGPLRPVAIHAMRDGHQVATANRNGTISLVDFAAEKVLGNSRVGTQLADFAVVPLVSGAERFLVTDEGQHEVLAVIARDHDFQTVAKLAVAPYPVSIRTTSRGDIATVASLWSRRLTIFSVQWSDDQATPNWKILHVVDLPFAPRFQQILPGDKRVVVFDAFGGRLAIVELSSGKIESTREFPGHAVRGLALAEQGTMLVAAHQMLNPFAHVNQSDIHWGLLMTNDLRWMKLTSLLEPERELYSGGRVHPLGIPGRGGGDPTGVAMTANGVAVACLGGVDRVQVVVDDRRAFEPVKVGRRPIAVVISRDGKQAIVANQLDDSLSIVRLNDSEVVSTIPLAECRGAGGLACQEQTHQPSVIERGESLFYDAKLSQEGWMSCHSCHTDGHSNFGRNDNLSDGGFGAPKLVISLLGRKGTAPFAWNADVPNLAEQVRNSIHKTMQSEIKSLADDDVAALAEYIESLPAPPSYDKLRGTADRAAIDRGRAVFESHDCAKCHAGPSYTSPSVEDVKLRDELGKKLFNPPSLLGAGQRDAFFHDGRATSLEEVFLKHRHPSDEVWHQAEVRDLVAFLRSL